MTTTNCSACEREITPGQAKEIIIRRNGVRKGIKPRINRMTVCVVCYPVRLSVWRKKHV